MDSLSEKIIGLPRLLSTPGSLSFSTALIILDAIIKDPYLAYSYDMLHAFDSGEWGKHQWPLFRDHLTQPQKVQLNRNMSQVPRWRGLNHYQEVTAVDFADGNNYRDILKCILPCIVDILPRDSVVVQAIRLCGIIRTIASLNPVSDEQIECLEKCLPKYEAICSCLSLDLDKNYNYPKHHTLLHLSEDLRAKGSTTNFKDTEVQMTQIDENQEAIARIRAAVDIHDKLMEEPVQEQNITDGDECPTPITSKDHWSLGSPLSSILANKYLLEHAERKGFRGFGRKLLFFLSEHINADERPSVPLEIAPYQFLYLRYRSIEDWQEKEDIFRCNPDFHRQPRYDCVLLNTNPVTFGRILALFSCYGLQKFGMTSHLFGYYVPANENRKPNGMGVRYMKRKNVISFYSNT
ncbi:hypothetical protein M422DRAFT_268237 [Sphaerobolus stellatus SS14]|uniref:Uncharacterized protein n=1 Tax=Sphaerobolus stellatus (strain SS14) TaxID=990650 RepID=A0A0C9U7D0_SPHS4|nr:hypothetical protein M422DRAFT_268237 [Sphaerobolus stellatus SS14]